MLPQAAEADRRQITRGLAGEPRGALKARLLLRELFGGEIRLVPDGQCGLVAHSNLHTAALLRDVGTVGSGGGIPTNSTIVIPVLNICWAANQHPHGGFACGSRHV